jgi:uncharacterized membrane protein YkoI
VNESDASDDEKDAGLTVKRSGGRAAAAMKKQDKPATAAAAASRRAAATAACSDSDQEDGSGQEEDETDLKQQKGGKSGGNKASGSWKRPKYNWFKMQKMLQEGGADQVRFGEGPTCWGWGGVTVQESTLQLHRVLLV